MIDVCAIADVKIRRRNPTGTKPVGVPVFFADILAFADKFSRARTGKKVNRS